jgi:predicted Zn-ribbon and HTH transcriptional regulator
MHPLTQDPRSEAYLRADAILSGREPLALANAFERSSKISDRGDEYIRVELKHCERCGRIFTREADSDERDCPLCQQKQRDTEGNRARRRVSNLQARHTHLGVSLRTAYLLSRRHDVSGMRSDLRRDAAAKLMSSGAPPE